MIGEAKLSIHSAPKMAPIWVRPAEACKLASIGNTKLYELIADGDLVSRKVGGARLILVASIAALGADSPDAAA